MLKKFMLFRRGLDPILLTIAVACFGVKLVPDKIILGIFCGIGLYLIIVRHRACRLIDRRYAFAAVAYGITVVTLGFVHGEVEANARWIAYPLYFLGAILLWPGTVLVRDPLRQIALGARLGLLFSIVWVLYEYWINSARIGFGGNAANAAFVIAALAILARFEVRDAPRFLPNSVLWFYLAMFPVIMTGTRSVLPLFVIVALVDLYIACKEFSVQRSGWTKPKAALSLIAIAVIAGTGFYTSDMIDQRLNYTIQEIDSLAEGTVLDTPPTGLEIRVALWKGALDVVAEHPVSGMGAVQSMRQILDGIPVQQLGHYKNFIHVHFFLLDELRIRGTIGLVFQLIFFIVVFARLFRDGTPNIRINSFIFLALLLLYGAMHGLLLGDRNIGVMVLFFFATLGDIRRKELRMRRTVTEVSPLSYDGSSSSPDGGELRPSSGRHV
ncbi:O-antigen ligase family protein [Limoniibacter endophyticus]|uniref:O-antigen ligase-related domain-containing protein n=1 Tax=Limoniibacter endophyticus TaxID=1565040 RepID=A0A8J3DGS3_9HYPH|nr:O-antigen ligase family protein [Limoniibacter endophyticus]GHC70117.1 hypothetical protein GCM10010136_16130 [Limoniibacter endophyticus]